MEDFRRMEWEYGYGKDSLRKRLINYKNLEECLSNPIAGTKNFKIFGEKKSLRDWFNDSRCGVDNMNTLRGRFIRNP